MSTGFREQALREMGLSPIWVRRVQDDATEVADRHAPDAVAALPTAPPLTLSGAPATPVQTADNGINTPDERQAAIAGMSWQVLGDAVAGCTACPLSATRRQTVFGAGVTDAPWMLVGEAPGEQEDAAGMPFVGPAGRLLDNMLRAAGLSREHETYITNTVKCHPPASRRPAQDEVQQCTPHLLRQIDLVQPRVILALGAVAAQCLLATDEPVGSLRGRVHLRRFGDREIPVIVTFHPAYVLRKLSEKARSWADLCLATATMRSLP